MRKVVNRDIWNRCFHSTFASLYTRCFCGREVTVQHIERCPEFRQHVIEAYDEAISQIPESERHELTLISLDKIEGIYYNTNTGEI